jgi:hypothetical protein
MEENRFVNIDITAEDYVERQQGPRSEFWTGGLICESPLALFSFRLNFHIVSSDPSGQQCWVPLIKILLAFFY